MRLAFPSILFVLCLALACTTGRGGAADGGRADSGSADSGAADGSLRDAPFVPFDRGPIPDGSWLDPDAACSLAVIEAEVERLPVDIIWMVDNSVSMAPAIAEVTSGLDDFAALVDASGLDFRVIMLSLRGRGALTIGGRARFGVCIPPPLSGDTACGDGPRFFQVEVDVHSTQQVEQFLGTLAQTPGYLAGEQHGSAPWRDLLRDSATKTIVVVSDDNSRTCALPVGATCSASEPPLTSTSLEDFPGGGNPFNSRELGPGILTPTYGALFEGYTFDAIYGWGDATDPSVACRYSDGSFPPSPGQTYTALVARTSGVRAQICDGSAAWGPFFAEVATAVTRTSRISCNIPIPPPPSGLVLDTDRVNVIVRGASGSTYLPQRTGAGACDERGGYYFDNPVTPTEVILCPVSCDAARAELTAPGTGVDVQLGCESILI